MNRSIELAKKIQKSQEWNLETCKELCKLAGLEKEWEETDGENFEAVVFKAAGILNVKIQ